MKADVDRLPFAALLATAAQVWLATVVSAATIDQVIVRQQWPWSADVKIEYRISGVTAPVDVAVRAYDGDVELALPAEAVAGDLYGIAEDGIGTIVINPHVAFGIEEMFFSEFRVKLSLSDSAVNANDPLCAEPLYRICDLTSGEVKDVSRADIMSDRSYGTYETDYGKVHPGFTTGATDVFIWTGVTNNPDYKTTKLVLRRIPAKNRTFPYGTAYCTLTNDYWMGVFDLTYEQYRILTGATAGQYATLEGSGTMPISGLPYKDYCNTVLPLLNSRIPSLEFGVPTEARLTYAIRGGAHGEANGWHGATERDLISWHKGNSDSWPHAVGTKLPNAYGLYDAIGDMNQLAVDTNADGPLPSDDVIEPCEENGRTRSTRGGAFNYKYCNTEYRSEGLAYNTGNPTVGYRPYACGRRAQPGATAASVDISHGSIVTTQESRTAAEELQRWVELSLGVRPPIVSAAGEGFVWHVGLRPAGGAEPAHAESAFWRVTQEGAWFWGGEAGVMHAVTIFAEERLGCRWPFGAAEYVPRRAEPVLETGEGSWSTPYLYHQIRSAWRRDPSCVTWKARMCYGGHDSPSFGHAFTDYWDRYSQAHPDFFAMRPDGCRLPMDAVPDDGAAAGSGYENASRISLCVSNPELSETVVANWVADGAGPYVNLCENDSWAMYHCHCPACNALDGETPTGSKADEHHAGRYVAFANRVLAAARKIRPDVRVTMYAYNASTYAPLNVKLDKGVILGLVPVVFGKEALARYLKDWKRAGMTDFVYRPNRHYYYRVRNLPLGCDEHFFDICRMMVRAGAIGFDYDSPNATGLFEWEVDYMVAHAMRDPSKPFSHWMRRYAESFGPVAGEVAAYYAYWRENVWKRRIEPDIGTLTLQSHVYDFAKGVIENATAYYRDEDFAEAGRFLDCALHRPGLDVSAQTLVEKLVLANRNAQLTFRAIRDKGASAGALDELVRFRQEHGFKLCPWEEIGRGDVCGMLARPEAAAIPVEDQYAPTPDPIWTNWE